MTDLANPTDTLDPTTRRPNGVRRDPSERTFELAAIVNLAVIGATFQQIADTILDPTAAAEKRDPRRSTKADADAVRHLLASPEGQRSLRYAVNEFQEHTDRFLVSAHLGALRLLVREMNEGAKPGDRIRAATAITALATKRVELSGPGGAPIELNAAVSDALDERILLMKERSKGIIEAFATSTEVEPGDDSSIGEGFSEVTEQSFVAGPSPTIAARVAEILASIPIPASVAVVPVGVARVEVVVAEPASKVVPRVRHRQPAPIIRPRRPR